MEAFNELRRQAKDKRDKIVSKARAEYEETLAKIAELEQSILGRDPPKHKSVAACIDSVLPKNQPFMLKEIQAKLETLDSSRIWHWRSLTSHLARRVKRGIVRRVSRCRPDTPTIYVIDDAKGAKVEQSPFDGMTLRQAVKSVLDARGQLKPGSSWSLMAHGCTPFRIELSWRDERTHESFALRFSTVLRVHRLRRFQTTTGSPSEVGVGQLVAPHRVGRSYLSDLVAKQAIDPQLHLRHNFGTLLSKGGVAPRTRQE
jgi:hypothetical protein